MSSTRLQNRRSIYKYQLYFYTIAINILIITGDWPFFLIKKNIYLAILHGLWDLRSPIRD